MRAKHEDLVKEREKQIATKRGEASRLEEEQKETSKKKKKSKQVGTYMNGSSPSVKRNRIFWLSSFSKRFSGIL